VHRKSFICIVLVAAFFIAWYYFPPFKNSIVQTEDYLKGLWHMLIE
jgi:hypothetical protein